MGKTVFIFPGQGSQYVGMGKGIWDAHEDVRRLYALAGEEAGLDIAALSFEGPAGELDSDLPAQLSVYTANEAYRLVIGRMGLRADAVTGYSMGFYSALVACGSVTFQSGLRMVRKAGETALAHGGGKGAMAAVIGLTVAEVEGICSGARSEGPVWVSNVNAARQALVSGSAEGVARAVALALEAGALSAYTLGMGAAYHSPMMEGASAIFSEYLRGVEFGGPSIPLLSYIDAGYLDTGAGIRDTVARQLSSRVLWKDSVLRLVADGADRFIETGPGSALTRMVRWVAREVEAVPAESLTGQPGQAGSSCRK